MAALTPTVALACFLQFAHLDNALWQVAPQTRVVLLKTDPVTLFSMDVLPSVAEVVVLVNKRATTEFVASQ